MMHIYQRDSDHIHEDKKEKKKILIELLMPSWDTC